MKCAGFVLAGGSSSRMGRDKALLPLAGATLLEHVAGQVRQATGSVVVIGPPERYAALGLRVVPDLVPGGGPLGGIFTALTRSPAEWNLIVACDLAGIRARFLRDLLEAARDSRADCVAPVDPEGFLQPLCAVWRRACLPVVAQALRQGQRKVLAVLARLSVAPYPVAGTAWLVNVNTPEDWAVAQTSRKPHE
ncbi:MAG: molybdenum cofactor guanylyltransferase [Bryobacterales bacterium]|nr:molybdenum cofactor guanylyltransferase [Bryobacteraceae bacterium]MDW8353129.1 molybdenum cofactor guanylyltransferase [Bryobacterales bacterium]